MILTAKTGETAVTSATYSSISTADGDQTATEDTEGWFKYMYVGKQRLNMRFILYKH